MSTSGLGAERRLRGFVPHLALLGAALACVVAARRAHVPDDVAWRLAFDAEATTEARIGAIQRLANRATARDPRLGDELVRALLASDDERLREYALTTDLCKHHTGRPGAEPALQSAYALAHPGPLGTAHHVRSVLLHLRKVGGVPVGGKWRLDWDEVHWLLAASSGGALPTAEEFARHLAAREAEGDEARTRLEDLERDER